MHHITIIDTPMGIVLLSNNSFKSILITSKLYYCFNSYNSFIIWKPSELPRQPTNIYKIR